MMQYETIGQEVAELDKRGHKIRKLGLCLLVAGTCALCLAVIGYGITWFLKTEIKDFAIDVPATLLPGTTESGGIPGTVDGPVTLDSIVKVLSSPIAIFLVVLLGTAPGFIRMLRGDGLEGFIPTAGLLAVFFVTQFMTGVMGSSEPDISSSDSSKSIVQHLIKGGDPARLVDYLKENALNTAKPQLIDYVTAQVSIKQDKPDVELIRKVVDYYKDKVAVRTEPETAGTAHPTSTLDDVPDDIRYVFEMTGFDKTVSSQASRYAHTKFSRIHLFSVFSTGGFTLGGFLALMGGAFYLCGSHVKRRVTFINDMAFK